MFRFSVFGLLVGFVLVAASLTPSLIPRGPELQGVLGGIVLAVGYLCGRIAESLWRAADMPAPTGRLRRIMLGGAISILLALMMFALLYHGNWQNDLRARMEMEPIDDANRLLGFVLFGLVSSLLFGLGAIISYAYKTIRMRLLRIMPERRASVLGLVAVGILVFVITRDGLLSTAIDALDTGYETAQELFETAPPPPTEGRKAGSSQSLVGWDAMGRPGRDFVLLGPDAAEISAFTGQPALDPIRVYVGRANAGTPKARAELALAELLRLGAFEREVLIIASPTGTGWLDAGSHDPVEYMHGGDIATVAVQYSYMQSPFALLFETQSGLEQASATVSKIYNHWRQLPHDKRPRLYIHGLSLGAWSSMYATNFFHLTNDPIDGALWAGPPFPSDFWNRVQRARNPGSPWVQPTIGDGSFVRFASRGDDGSGGAAPWGDVRIMFLQYPSDAIVFYEPHSLWRAPVWLKEPLGEGVSPRMMFIPIVTKLQLALDMILASDVPPGFGHAYYARDYIEPWVQVTAPEGWTQFDTERLKVRCNNGFRVGCRPRIE